MSRTFPTIIMSLLILTGCTEEPQLLPYRGEEVRIEFGVKAYEEACGESITLSPEEAKRVERLLLSAPLPRAGITRSEMVQITSDIKFPGFGLSEGGRTQPDGARLWLVQIEVPCRAKERVITFREKQSRYFVIDDFVIPEASGPIIEVSGAGSDLIYKLPEGKPPIRRTAMASNGGGA